jgi:hypothetical protein
MRGRFRVWSSEARDLFKESLHIVCCKLVLATRKEDNGASSLKFWLHQAGRVPVSLGFIGDRRGFAQMGEECRVSLHIPVRKLECSDKCLEYPSMTGGGPQNGGNGSPVSLRLVILLVLTAPAATPTGAASCSIGRTPSTHEEKWPGRISHLEHARAVLDVVRVNLLPHPVQPGSWDPTRAQPLPRPSSTSPAPLEAGASPASCSESSRKRITLGTTAPLRPPTGLLPLCLPSLC